MAIPFTNQASLTYNNNTVLSNVAAGELVEDLSATKTALSENYSVGDTVTFVVNVANNGTNNFTGLTMEDDLGATTLTNGTTVYPLSYVPDTMRFFVNGVLQTPTPTVTAGPPMTVTNIDIPAGANAQLVYEATITEFADPNANGSITNMAVFSGAINEPFSAEETVTKNTEPTLTISKSVSPTTVSENGQLTYTITIFNYGNTEVPVTGDTVLTDVLDPALNNLTVTFNGQPWTLGTNYTYDNGTFATLPGQISVPAATYSQNPTSGAYTTDPGVSTLVLTGTV